ncbi:Putative alpha-acetolactate decarboxylase [Septoria linicola]|uniref:Alpha-acetolactate decarboxylase n=1 Tax=Septoria linicola TaxID=215465 RepID=A0A9Q9AH24_9PEZI|nr:putative alpha-acetolactate decarboxylase [Septoria linicola]USW49042.1 Putative alpha-acetolactate decarboxylase [Septoria linicola]
MAKTIPNDIFQYSLLSAYNAGLKDGGPPVPFLKTQGSHGIGFLEDEESDLIQIDGVAYTIDQDGDVDLAEKDDAAPFVMITNFQPKKREQPPASTTAKQVKELFARNRNTPITFRVKGNFKYINTKQQTYWDVSGQLFGFCVPDWQKAVSGEGLQCMFLSEDEEHGGRVIDFETGVGAVLEWATCGRLHLGFPQDEEFEEIRL